MDECNTSKKCHLCGYELVHVTSKFSCEGHRACKSRRVYLARAASIWGVKYVDCLMHVESILADFNFRVFHDHSRTIYVYRVDIHPTQTLYKLSVLCLREVHESGCECGAKYGAAGGTTACLS